jgi:hypothetical protein
LNLFYGFIMITGPEGYGAPQMAADAEAAETRWLEGMQTGAKLRITAEIAGLIATKLLEIAPAERILFEDLPDITLSTKELLDIVDSFEDPLRAAATIREAVEAIYRAAHQEEGVAGRAKERRDYLKERLRNDAAAEAPVV